MVESWMKELTRKYRNIETYKVDEANEIILKAIAKLDRLKMRTRKQVLSTRTRRRF